MTRISRPPAGGGAVASPAGVGAVVPRPTRSRWVLALPIAVVAALAGLLAAAAGGTLHRATDVEVRQAVFDRSASAGGEGERAGAAGAGRATVQAAGWLEADPFVVSCAGLAAGVLEEVLVLEGDRVEAGECIARLVSADAELSLRAAEAELQSARGQAASARAELASAQAEWDAPVERERASGAALAAVARVEAELAQLPSLIAADEALLAQLQEQASLSREALAAGGANELETLILEKRALAQAATLEALRLREGILLAELDEARAERDAAIRGASLRIAEARGLAVARAMVEEADAMVLLAEVRRDTAHLQLERMEIRSPIAGVVQRRLASPGRRIMPESDDPEGAVVATLYDPARLQVRVDVPLADVGQIVVGQACEVSVEVLPDVVFAGEVTRIGHEANLQKNTLEVKVRVIDPSPLLRPEMLTRVKFVGAGGGAVGGGAGGDGDRTDETVLVPQEVLEEAAEGTRVWAVRERRGDHGAVEPVAVRVLGMEGGWSRVSGEVRAGDLLVSAPSGLRAGGLVRVHRPRGTAGNGGTP